MLVPLLLAGCAVAPPAAAPAPGRPVTLELTAVPFHDQAPLHCGPAALAMALGAEGVAVTPEQLSPMLVLPARGGTLQAEMLGAARRQGRLPLPLEGGLPALRAELDAGRPVVVLQNLALPVWPMWHYAVVIGYDLGAGTLLLRSGSERRLVLPARTFEHTWARSGHWAIVLLKPGEAPADPAAPAWPQAVADFARVAPPAAAVAAYEALVMHRPREPGGWLGLADSRRRQGDALAARRALQQAAERFDSAAAWNNLAVLRREAGDLDGARLALAQAQRRVAEAEPALADAVAATAAEMPPAGAPAKPAQKRSSARR